MSDSFSRVEVASCLRVGLIKLHTYRTDKTVEEALDGEGMWPSAAKSFCVSKCLF